MTELRKLRDRLGKLGGERSLNLPPLNFQNTQSEHETDIDDYI